MRKSILGLSIVAGLMAASGAAFAGPTATIDGITIPVGVDPNGFVIDTEKSAEVLVQQKGDPFFGVFSVAFISDNALGTTWTSGQNGAYLYGVFSGFVTDSITTTASGTSILFTGGQISYYTDTTNHFTANAGSTAADITATSQGKLWLSATPQVINAAGDTLAISIPAGQSLTQFGGFGNTPATASALLDVTGGDAAYNFNTNSLKNSFSGAMADIAFAGQASSGVSGDFQVSGTNAIKANTVPEPVTLSLFGAGLFGAAALRRRKKKQA